MAVIGGLLIIGFSMVFTTVAFPDYFTEIQSVQREALAAQGKSEAEIAEALSAGAAMETPIMNALTGFMATVITGVLTALIAAWFIRAKRAVPVSRV
jgi:hypothetical protein